MLDDQRPTLTLTYPVPGMNAELSRLVIGMHDYGTGLNDASFRVTADFAIDGVAAGMDLGSKFKPLAQGVREFKLEKPLTELTRGTITVRVADKQGM